MGNGVRFWVGAIALAAAVFPASLASAQFEPAGAVSVVGAFPGRGDLGGELLLDLGGAVDAFQLGMVLGVGALSSDADERSRVFMPFGVSAAYVPDLGLVSPALRVRAGGWAGATHDGLAAGGLFSACAQVALALARTLRLVGGAEFTALLGHGSRFAVGPSLGLLFLQDGSGL